MKNEKLSKLMKNKKVMIIGGAIVCVLVIAIISFGLFVNKEAKQVIGNTINPIMGTIDNNIEETGYVTVDDTYSVVSSVNAKIVSCEFKEGDMIEEGQVLYSLDVTDISNQIQTMKVNLEKTNATYQQNLKAVSDLTVKAHSSGIITKLYVHKGDYVSTGTKIADVLDSKNLVLKIPFNASDKDSLYTGASAQITMSSDGSVIYGTVKKVYDAEQSFAGGKSGIVTEISVSNPGALKKGDKAFAKVGNVASLSSGEFQNLTEQTIVAVQSGQVQEIYVNEGDAVSNGTKVILIKNDSLSNSVQNSQLAIKEINTNLSQLNAKLADYKIVSPASGIVTLKSANVGDYASPEFVLAEISSSLASFVKVDIDEIYINQISLGQSATVTLQDGSDTEYTGVVVEISDTGVAENGVTYYPVKIALDNYDGLKNAMNVDVKILIERKENVMLLPSKAVYDGRVRIVGSKKLEWRDVTTGIDDGEFTEILSGITLEDDILDED